MVPGPRYGLGTDGVTPTVTRVLFVCVHPVSQGDSRHSLTLSHCTSSSCPVPISHDTDRSRPSPTDTRPVLPPGPTLPLERSVPVWFHVSGVLSSVELLAFSPVPPAPPVLDHPLLLLPDYSLLHPVRTVIPEEPGPLLDPNKSSVILSTPYET